MLRRIKEFHQSSRETEYIEHYQWRGTLSVYVDWINRGDWRCGVYLTRPHGVTGGESVSHWGYFDYGRTWWSIWRGVLWTNSLRVLGYFLNRMSRGRERERGVDDRLTCTGVTEGGKVTGTLRMTGDVTP